MMNATQLAREAGTPAQLGAALRLLLQEARLSHRELASRLKHAGIAGVSRSTIGHHCRGD